jgi:hypothetical protein
MSHILGELGANCKISILNPLTLYICTLIINHVLTFIVTLISFIRSSSFSKDSMHVVRGQAHILEFTIVGLSSSLMPTTDVSCGVLDVALLESSPPSFCIISEMSRLLCFECVWPLPMHA